MESKTAVTLTPAEILAFRDKLKARRFSIDEQTKLRLEKAHKVALQAAGMLKEKFSAERVVAFGSLVSPELFHARSDIDLAAWGIDEREYYRAVGLLQSLDVGFSIDLILFEEASARLKEMILSEGLDL